MQGLRLVAAILLVGIGAVWVGQGLGFLPGSFMTGQTFWALAGIVAIGVGGYLGRGSLRRR
jgi:uncharacterized membrane protein